MLCHSKNNGLFPANLWFSSREGSPYVALDFKDFVHRVVSVLGPLRPAAVARIESKIALNAAAMFYSSRTMPGSKKIVAELVRVSAGKVDHRPYELAG